MALGLVGALVVVVVVAVVAAVTTKTPAPHATALPAGDRNASPALRAAARAVGFYPHRIAGSGQIEGQPIEGVTPPAVTSLLAPGSLGAALRPQHSGGREAAPGLPPREDGAARALRHLVPALCRRGATPEGARREAFAQALRVRRGERRRRGSGERPRLPHLFRSSVPGAARPELEPRKLQPSREPGRGLEGLQAHRVSRRST